MPKPRKALVSLDVTTPYYLLQPALRPQTFILCGINFVLGQSFEHRQQWIEDKLLELASKFAIDLCAYLFSILRGRNVF